MRRNANELYFELYKIFDKYVLFSPLRISRESIGDNLYLYELRHGTDGIITEISRGILVNFWGSVISKDKLLEDDEKYRIVDEANDVIDNIDAKALTIREYLNNEVI